LEAHNRERLARLQAVKAKEDDDITDEQAWAHREQLREASHQRKANEAAILARSNAESRARRDRQESKNDADATDEIMWTKRSELAMKSRTRREQVSRALAAQNAETRTRLRRIVPTFERLNMDAHQVRWGRVLRKAPVGRDSRTGGRTPRPHDVRC